MPRMDMEYSAEQLAVEELWRSLSNISIYNQLGQIKFFSQKIDFSLIWG